MRETLRRIAGYTVGTALAPLPFPLRLLVARAVDAACHPSRFAESRIARAQLRFWNTLVLGLVFFLGFPLTKLGQSVLQLLRRGKSQKEGEWHPRPDPDEFTRGIEDPF